MEERNYWKRAIRHRVSRRSMLRGAGAAGVGLAGAALIGCGGDDEDEEEMTATATETGGGEATATATATEEAAGDTKRGGLVRIARAGDPPSIAPYGNASFEVKVFASAVYSRLYMLGAGPGVEGNSAPPVPDLAESAETDDGTTWVVKLKPAKFHNKPPVDGRDVTAEDVKFSFDRMMAPDSPQRPLGESAGWRSVEVIDDRTVRFTLADVNPVFLDDLADTNKLFVMPQEADGGFKPETEAIGSGPWIFQEYNTSQNIKFTRNADFYMEPPLADDLEYVIIPEYANRLAQFQAGNLTLQGINANDVLQLRGDQPDVQWLGVQPQLLSFIYFSPEDMDPDAPWRDERFRRAVSMSLDRDDITDFAYNVSELREAGLNPRDTWNNLIPAGMTRWWLDPQSAEQGESAKYFEYNPDEARSLLDAMGASGASFTFQYTGNRYGSTFNSVAEATANYLADLGLQPNTDVQDYQSKYITQTFAGNFNGVAFGYETPFPEVGGYFPRMFGDDPLNHSRINDPDINDLARKQAVELDEEQRREFIWEIQRINDTKMYYVPNQAGAGTGWTAYQPNVAVVFDTRGYGFAREVAPQLWFSDA